MLESHGSQPHAPVPRATAVLRSFIPLAVAIVLLTGLMYLVVQQVLRQGADDVLVQMAEDASAALGRGEVGRDVVPVDIATSLAPYLIVFDASGRPVGGSGRLHGNLPAVPAGVLEAARQRGENRVTWQPEPGVRSATVIVPVRDGGYVLAGRSLRLVEQRTNNFRGLIAVGGLFTLAMTLAAHVGASFSSPGRRDGAS